MDTNKTFPVLYKKTSTGAIQQWQVTVTEDNSRALLTSEYGKRGGKLQSSTEVISVGKNLGKANETTPMQQALLQAESEFTQKLKKGYVRTPEDAAAERVDDAVEGGVFPMLAHKYTEYPDKIHFPAIAQPKLDGHRCIAMPDASLWSRTRKPIQGKDHIEKVLRLSTLPLVFPFDGELYNHEYRNNFEELSHLIRQSSFIPGCENIQYHVYDIPIPGVPNLERVKMLEEYRPKFVGTPVIIVESIIVNNEEELLNAFYYFTSLGYEGCMVRNCDGFYVNKRSYDLQKLKSRDDEEFEIVGIKLSTKGVMAGLPVFICQTKEGETFDVSMVGSKKDLAKYADPTLSVGRKLTVKFQGYTKKNHVPRFPVGQRFKEDTV